MDNDLSDLDRGREFLKEGRALDALQLYAAMIRSGDNRADVYRDACQALIAAVSGGVELNTWKLSERKELIASLVLQENCNVSPPILQYSIASHFTSGAQKIIERISEVLAPVVKELLQKKEISKNLVLLILLLRESLGGIIAQDRISELHLAWIDRFSFEDLAVPYNCMFDQKTFWRNRDDIISKLLGSITNAELFDRFSLYHLVFFEWLSHRDISYAGGEWLGKIKTRLDQSISQVELSAAKSLFVRYFSCDRMAEAAQEVPGLEKDLVQIAGDVASGKKKLQATTDSARLNDTIGTRLFNSRIWQGALAANSLARSRLPSISCSKRRIKVAVCISGQLRGYDRAFPSWKRTLLNNVEYELFVHSWTGVGRSGAEPSRYVLPFDGRNFVDTYRQLCLQVGFGDFKARYPNLFARLADTGKVTEREISEFYGTPNVWLDDDTNPSFAALSNQEKMHSKIKYCFDKVMRSGREYDLFLRLRPDKPIKYLGYRWNDLREICGRSPLLFADLAAGVHYTNPMIGDQFAVGALQSMQIYSSTWSLYPQLAANGLLNCAKPFVGHVSLAHVCWLHGIKVEKAPIHFGQLQEPARLSTKMISECLELDAKGRMDRVDRLLLDSAAADFRVI